MRAPFQVLVIPYRQTASDFEFAVLKRSDAEYWQFVAGGGEDDETPLQAASRETKEEIGISINDRFLQLDSMATVPKNCFAAADSWGKKFMSFRNTALRLMLVAMPLAFPMSTKNYVGLPMNRLAFCLSGIAIEMHFGN